MRELNKVDVSIDGDEEANELRTLLYNDVRLDIILETEEWNQSQRKRNERYRRRLLMSVTELRNQAKWPNDINPQEWTLQRLESAIHVIERGGVLTNVKDVVPRCTTTSDCDRRRSDTCAERICN